MTRASKTPILQAQKSRARLQAKARRAAVGGRPEKAIELLRRWPALRFRGASIAGYSPLGCEMDVRPLLHALQASGQQTYLPAITRKAKPLEFRRYQAADVLKSGPHGTFQPAANAPTGRPDVVLVPLLAYTRGGGRLGYGGGYYDRTLSALRDQAAVFACGVAFSAQEAASLPLGAHDEYLDAVLNETGFHLTGLS